MEVEARLRAFAAVARHGSFSRAASELHVSQPAVSKHVALLERQLGVVLIRRRPTVGLTEAGAFLAEHVLRAEALLERARHGVAAIAGAEGGRLAIGGSGTPGTYVLPPVVARFAAERPSVEVDFRLGTSAEIVAAVLGHELELGVVGGLAATPALEVEPLFEDEIVPVGTPELAARRLSVAALGELTWAHREEGSATREALEAELRSLNIAARHRVALPSWEAIKIFVARGGGVAACSRLAIDVELHAGTLGILQISGWRLGRTIAAIHAREVPLSPPAATFLGLLREDVARHGLSSPA